MAPQRSSMVVRWAFRLFLIAALLLVWMVCAPHEYGLDAVLDLVMHQRPARRAETVRHHDDDAVPHELTHILSLGHGQDWYCRLQPLTDAAKQKMTRFPAEFGTTGRSRVEWSAHESPRTSYDFENGFHDWRMRDLELYRTRTRDRTEAREAAEAFLTETIAARKQGGIDAPRLARLCELGVAAIDGGSTDPLVLAWYADIALRTRSLAAPIGPLVEWALADLKESRYPASVEAFLRFSLQSVQYEDNSRILRTEAFHDAILRWLVEESSRPSGLRFTYKRLRQFLDAPGASPRALVVAMSRDDRISPWLTHYLAGDVLTSYGWEIQNRMAERRVESIDGITFLELFDLATMHLQSAWMLQPNCPDPCAKLAHTSQWDTVDLPTPADWAQKAFDLEFDHEWTLNNYTASVTWGDRVDAARTLSLAADCVETRRLESAVPYAALTLFHKLIEKESIPAGQLFNRFPFAEATATALANEWLRIARSPQEAPRLKRPLERGEGERLIQIFLMNRRFDMARELALATPLPRPLRRLGDGSRGSEYVLAHLLAYSPEHRALIDRAEAALFDFHAELPMTLLDDCLDRIQATGERARDYHRILSLLIDQRRKWDGGEWIDVSMSSPDDSLLIRSDEWRSRDDGPEIELQSGLVPRTLQMGIGFVLPFEAPIEIEVALDATVTDAVGLYWAPRVRRVEVEPADELETRSRKETEFPFFGFLDDSSSGQIRIDTRLIPPQPKHRIPPPGAQSRYHLRLWPRRYEFELNEYLFSGDLAAPPSSAGRMFIGEPFFRDRPRQEDHSTGSIRLGRLRLRRLSQSQPPIETSPYQDRLEYWRQRYSHHPDDLLSGRNLASLLVESAPQQALTVTHALRERSPRLNNVALIRARALVELGKLEEAEHDLTLTSGFDTDFLGMDTERERIAIMRQGVDSSLARSLKNRLSPQGVRLFPTTYTREVDTIYARERVRKLPGDLPHLRWKTDGALSELRSTFQEAIQMASPGPRRDRLEREYDEALKEFQRLAPTPK